MRWPRLEWSGMCLREGSEGREGGGVRESKSEGMCELRKDSSGMW